jgi:methyl-accepting chemotaxis protein
MVDVRKAGRVREKELRAERDRMEVIEALRHGNIYEVFAKSKDFKIVDFFDFFANQWKQWKGNLVQDSPVKSDWASCREPDINVFPIHQRDASLNSRDPGTGGHFTDEMLAYLAGKGMRFKAATVGEGAPLPEGELTPEELMEMVPETLAEWDQFMEDAWGQIFDAQMVSDYRSRMAEIKRDVQRIITLAKQGVIGPEFVLIALAKVNLTKNGVLMTWLGKKAFHLNESLNRVANDLYETSSADPFAFQGELILSREKTRDQTMQMQLLMGDMQKVMQDVAGTLEHVHSAMSEINRTRREIITKVAAH